MAVPLGMGRRSSPVTPGMITGWCETGWGEGEGEWEGANDWGRGEGFLEVETIFDDGFAFTVEGGLGVVDAAGFAFTVLDVPLVVLDFLAGGS